MNVNDRDVFINTYFELEIQSYRWVQLPKYAAMDLEKEHDLPSSAYHEYVQGGYVYREYHVDTHPSLFDYVRNKKHGGDLSV